MKRWLLVAGIVCWTAGTQAVTHATPATQLELRVHPLECVLDTIATGSSSSTQLSPQECTTTSIPQAPPLIAVNEPAEANTTTIANAPQTMVADGSEQLTPEHKNVVSPVGQIANVGTLITQNPMYASMGMIVLMPLSLLASKFLSAGGLRRAVTWVVERLPF